MTINDFINKGELISYATIAIDGKREPWKHQAMCRFAQLCVTKLRRIGDDMGHAQMDHHYGIELICTFTRVCDLAMHVDSHDDIQEALAAVLAQHMSIVVHG